jgi:hypothetical protein
MKERPNTLKRRQGCVIFLKIKEEKMKRMTSFLMTIMIFSTLLTFGACSEVEISAKNIDVQQYYNVSLAPFVIPDLFIYFENVTEKAVYSANRGTVINKAFSHPLSEAGVFEIEITARDRSSFSICLNISLTPRPRLNTPPTWERLRTGYSSSPFLLGTSR